ncbi:MAG: 1,4-alpha-glucan branching enzyme GlgB [Chlamydiales bacterium]|nr:1,4-alpha-glucan branching enzyme GlgB [Chlamydiales bacterium]
MGEYWYKEAIIYELHVKCFYDSSGDGCGDFKGLTQKLDYLQELGVTAIWLLPFYPSPLKDDGYDISDYTDVHPQYGEIKDFKEFLYQAHSRGLKVITELVINHTSDQHPWFQRARKAAKGSNERDFYVWSEQQELYKEARIIFQDFEASNWTWDRELQSYYWHRFYSHQPDLNFENPEVHKALFQKMSFWLKMGVDGMRLDAIPYLYEQEGTNCENLLQTHEFLKKLRTHVDENFNDRMLLAEANQWPEDAAKYFGEGDECQMAFHFPVMPRLFMAIHLEDSLPIVEIMGQTPQIPENCQWALFLRNHDELTLEMVTDEERDYMFRVYAHDPQARVNLGIRRRLAPLLKNDRRKIELMNVLLFSLNGTPVLYYGDELGMGDNIYLGDRNGVRTPMQWSNDRNAGFSRANPQQLYLPPIIDPEYHYETVNVEAQLNNPYSLLWWTKQLISLRKRFKSFSYGTTNFLQVENRKVLVFFREYEDELIMIITNLSRFAQYVELDLQHYNGYKVVEMFSGEKFPSIGELPYFLTLGPYGYYWFSLEKQPEKSLLEQIDLKREKQVAEIAFKGDVEKLFYSQSRSLLGSTVKKYLYKRSWFRPFLTSLDRTKICISDHLVLAKTSKHKIHVLFVEIVLTTGVVHHIPLFLAHYGGETAKGKLDFSPETIVAKIVQGKSDSVIVDVGMDPDLSKELMQMIQEQKKIKGESGELKGKKLPLIHENLDRFPSIESGWIFRKEGVILTPLQDGVLKVFSRIEEGMHLDVEMRLFLSKQAEFKAYLPLLGYIEYTSPDKTSLAIAEEVVSHRAEYNAKILSIEAAHRFLVRMEAMQEPLNEEILLPKNTLMDLAYGELDPELRRLLEDHPEVSHLLGETTADFHRAMHSNHEDSNFSPLKFTLFYQRSMYQTIRRKIGLAYGKLKSLYPTLDENSQKKVNILFSHHEHIIKKLHILPHHKFYAERTRYHGNFVLENLHYTGKEFLIANFEGNPSYSYTERRYKRSPLLDVASMLFSIAETSFEAVERLQARGLIAEGDLDQMHKYAHVWAMWTGSSFLRAYLLKAGEYQILPSSQKEIDFLLGVFLLERCMEHLADPKEKKINFAIWTLLHWLPIYETFELS